MYDYHMHLERGSLTVAWLKRFVERAEEVGVREIGVAEHLYRFREAGDLLRNSYVAGRSIHRAEEYIRLIERARATGLPVRFGLEVDYVPGKEERTAAILAEFPLDFVIGSVHWLGDWGFDTDPETWRGRSVDEVYREYYDTLARAAGSGMFDIMGHPGNIAFHGFRPAEALRRELEGEFLERIARLPVVLEINSGGLLRPARETFPPLEMARRIAAKGFQVSTGSDAHRPEDVGHDFPRLYQMLKELGIAKITCFQGRRPVPRVL